MWMRGSVTWRWATDLRRDRKPRTPAETPNARKDICRGRRSGGAHAVQVPAISPIPVTWEAGSGRVFTQFSAACGMFGVAYAHGKNRGTCLSSTPMIPVGSRPPRSTRRARQLDPFPAAGPRGPVAFVAGPSGPCGRLQVHWHRPSGAEA